MKMETTCQSLCNEPKQCLVEIYSPECLYEKTSIIYFFKQIKKFFYLLIDTCIRVRNDYQKVYNAATITTTTDSNDDDYNNNYNTESILFLTTSRNVLLS